MARATYFLTSTSQDREGSWSPPVDIFETRDGWLLRFELAGVRPEDVELRLSRNRVMLHGMRRDYMLEEGCRFYCMEISYSRFERVIELPVDLDGARLALDYRDGILLVRISLGHQSPEERS